jgi:hypothetical protein
MTYATSGQDYLFLPIFTVRTRSLDLVAIGKHVIFTWIPSHIGIHGNTVVDREAKNAMDDPVSKYYIPYSDIKPLIVKYHML